MVSTTRPWECGFCIEAAFQVKFEENLFSEGDMFPFRFAIGAALGRFKHQFQQDRKKYESNPDKHGDVPDNSLTEARGLVAILKLAPSRRRKPWIVSLLLWFLLCFLLRFRHRNHI